MENFLLNIPSSPIGWIGLFFTGAASAALFLNRVRTYDLKILRESNQDLRTAHDDNSSKIATLEKTVDDLYKKVKVLEETNKTLEDLVILALKQYFTNNPGMAKDLKKIVKAV